MKKIFLALLLIVLGFTMKADFILAQENQVEIHFFYSAICPHCAEEEEFLKGLEKKYPEIEIKRYEVFIKQKTKRF